MKGEQKVSWLYCYVKSIVLKNMFPVLSRYFIGLDIIDWSSASSVILDGFLDQMQAEP